MPENINFSKIKIFIPSCLAFHCKLIILGQIKYIEFKKSDRKERVGL
jgi:hypothetical protein